MPKHIPEMVTRGICWAYFEPCPVLQVRVATEGVNGTVGGTDVATHLYIAAMCAHPHFRMAKEDFKVRQPFLLTLPLKSILWCLICVSVCRQVMVVQSVSQTSELESIKKLYRWEWILLFFPIDWQVHLFLSFVNDTDAYCPVIWCHVDKCAAKIHALLFVACKIMLSFIFFFLTLQELIWSQSSSIKKLKL